MIAAIANFFRALFGATDAVASAVKQRDAELNTPDQQANARAATEQQITDDATRAVADRDAKAVREQLAE